MHSVTKAAEVTTPETGAVLCDKSIPRKQLNGPKHSRYQPGETLYALAALGWARAPPERSHSFMFFLLLPSFLILTHSHGLCTCHTQRDAKDSVTDKCEYSAFKTACCGHNIILKHSITENVYRIFAVFTRTILENWLKVV